MRRPIIKRPRAAKRPGRSAALAHLPSFVNKVQSTANGIMRRGERGAFGDRKVFISSTWAKMRLDATRAGRDFMSLDNFKRLLNEARRRGLIRLHRADLVEEMDPYLVKTSLIQPWDETGPTFHFIEVA